MVYKNKHVLLTLVKIGFNVDDRDVQGADLKGVVKILAGAAVPLRHLLLAVVVPDGGHERGACGDGLNHRREGVPPRRVKVGVGKIPCNDNGGDRVRVDRFVRGRERKGRGERVAEAGVARRT
jgi:hypothetical protein